MSSLVVSVEIPDKEWYKSISERKKVPPRCPFATVKACPRFYQSLSLLGEAGSTQIDSKEDKNLLKYWKKSDLWPVTMEYATSVSGAEGDPSTFSNFCPEVAYNRFGYFASFLARYADEIDIDAAHGKLGKEGAQPNDWRWTWASISKMHYTECPLYSVLVHRSTDNLSTSGIPTEAHKEQWYKRPIGLIIIGILITVIGGLILHLLL